MALAAVAAGLCAAGCGAGEVEPVELDLTRVGSAWIGGRPSPPPTRVGGLAPPRLVQPAGPSLDLFLRLPRASELRFGLPGGAANGVRVRVASDTRQRAPELDAGDGDFRVALDAFDGEIVRLRLENDTGVWLRPRLVGTVARAPPLLAFPGRTARPPNIVLYVVDTLRADRLSASGYPRPTSPHLERLARRAVRFSNAYAPGPDTLTTIPSLFTSVSPPEAQQRLPADAPDRATTLAEALRRAGYDTAAFQANALLRERLGFARGFRRYRHHGQAAEKVRAEVLHEEAFAWLEAARAPFFLYVQSMDVHAPYPPPPPFRGRFGCDAAEPEDPSCYDEAIAYADHEIGRLLARLDELGLRDTTAVVVTSDHGESLGEGGRWLHSNSLHEEQLRVPLLVALPGQQQPETRDAIVSLLDLAPTLVELAGAEPPTSFEGSSWLRAADPTRPRAVAGYHWRVGWYVREGRWKLVEGVRRSQLFDLVADPAETRNLLRERPVTAGYLEGLLWEGAPSFRAGRRHQPSAWANLPEDARPDFESALRALGYVE